MRTVIISMEFPGKDVALMTSYVSNIPSYACTSSHICKLPMESRWHKMKRTFHTVMCGFPLGYISENNYDNNNMIMTFKSNSQRFYIG